MKSTKKLLAVTFLVLSVVLASVGAVYGITFGELDGDGHPYVGLVLFFDDAEEYMWRCSGTLLSPTVFLTAGHCTFGTTSAKVMFDTDLSELEYPYPTCAGYDLLRWHTHRKPRLQ